MYFGSDSFVAILTLNNAPFRKMQRPRAFNRNNVVG